MGQTARTALANIQCRDAGYFNSAFASAHNDILEERKRFSLFFSNLETNKIHKRKHMLYVCTNKIQFVIPNTYFIFISLLCAGYLYALAHGTDVDGKV